MAKKLNSWSACGEAAENEQCALVARDLEKAQARVEELEKESDEVHGDLVTMMANRNTAQAQVEQLERDADDAAGMNAIAEKKANQRLRDVADWIANRSGLEPGHRTLAMAIAGFVRCNCGGSGQFEVNVNEELAKMVICPCTTTGHTGWVPSE